MLNCIYETYWQQVNLLLRVNAQAKRASTAERQPEPGSPPNALRLSEGLAIDRRCAEARF